MLRTNHVMLRLQGAARPFQSMCNGGGGRAPDPDPSTGYAQRMSAETAQQAQDFYENVIYPETRSRTRAQDRLLTRFVGGAEEVQRAQLEQMRQGRDRYNSTFRPLEDRFIADMLASQGEAGQAAAAGRATADVAQQFGLARQQIARQLTRSGVNPASGRAIGLQARMASDEALAKVTGANKAREQAKGLGLAKLSDAINMGRGVATGQSNAAQLALSAGNSGAGLGQQGVANVQGLGNQYMGAQGQIAGMWGNAGQLGLSNYNARLNAWNANEQAAAAQSAGMGTAAGMIASAAIMASDRRAKENIEPVGTSPAGYPIYEFNYIGNPVRFRGVIAQDIQKLKPDAVVEEDGKLLVDYAKLDVQMEVV